MQPADSDGESPQRGVVGSLREHGTKVSLVGFGLILVSTRVLSRDGHTPLSVLVLIAGFLALVAPLIAGVLLRVRDDHP